MVGKLSVVRDNDLNLIKHYILYKKNVASYKHISFYKICELYWH